MPFCFYFLNLVEVTYLYSEYYLHQRNADPVILVREKKRERGRGKKIYDCLIMQWAGSMQTHVVQIERLHGISSMTVIQVVSMILPLCLEFLFVFILLGEDRSIF